MARDAGYVLPAVFPDNANLIESIAANAVYDSVAPVLAALITDAGIDPPAHRNQLLASDSFNADNREIGVGHGFNVTSNYRNYWAIQIARTDPTDVFLMGVVYDDANQNGRYDLNEGLAGVNLAAHPLAGGSDLVSATNAQGGWSIKAAPNTQYIVSATGSPFAGITRVLVSLATSNVEVDFLSGVNQAQVNFGQPEDLSPTANVDSGSVPGSETVSVDVLVNDTDLEGGLDVASLALAQLPTHGQAQVNTVNHQFVYTATFGYEGDDSFSYTVSDIYGQTSNVATVSITVTPAISFPWHNNDIAEDVNGLNGVTNLDAFLLISELRSHGPRALVLPTEDNHPPLFYDVHADNQFTNLDVFAVIAALRVQVGSERERLSNPNQTGSPRTARTPAGTDLWDESLLAFMSDWTGTNFSAALKRRRQP